MQSSTHLRPGPIEVVASSRSRRPRPTSGSGYISIQQNHDDVTIHGDWTQLRAIAQAILTATEHHHATPHSGPTATTIEVVAADDPIAWPGEVITTGDLAVEPV